MELCTDFLELLLITFFFKVLFERVEVKFANRAI